jgi:hypothetical protein
MTFGLEDFEAFHHRVKRIRDEQTEPVNPSVRNIMIPSPCQGIQLLLSAGELEDYLSLLEHADSELQSLNLISLFNQ